MKLPAVAGFTLTVAELEVSDEYWAVMVCEPSAKASGGQCSATADPTTPQCQSPSSRRRRSPFLWKKQA